MDRQTEINENPFNRINKYLLPFILLGQEQESLEYEFRLVKAEKEAERQRIEAQGKADANTILSESLTDEILRNKGIDATLRLAESSNAKVVVFG